MLWFAATREASAEDRQRLVEAAVPFFCGKPVRLHNSASGHPRSLLGNAPKRGRASVPHRLVPALSQKRPGDTSAASRPARTAPDFRREDCRLGDRARRFLPVQPKERATDTKGRRSRETDTLRCMEPATGSLHAFRPNSSRTIPPAGPHAAIDFTIVANAGGIEVAVIVANTE